VRAGTHIRRYPWLVVSLLAVIGVVLLAAFPARAYRDQQRERQELAGQIQALTSANEVLAEQAQQLETDATIERLARERYHLVRPGEEAYAILPSNSPPPAAAAVAAPAPPPPDQNWWSRAWSRVTALF
jgi:cell division protein FtsB